MAALSTVCPLVYTEFSAGNFTVKKTNNAFSAMAIDQAHEQCNASVKGDGGAVGLTDDEHALRRWMVAGPEVARVISEFENQTKVSSNLNHHEQTESMQATFRNEVSALLATFEELGSPFSDDCGDLVVLHSRGVVPCSANDIARIKVTGEEQYEEFIKSRFVDKSTSIYAPLKRNKLAPFSVQRPSTTRNKQLLATAKNDCDLFSRLYIGCQTRNGNLETFFQHENQPYPPAISEFGALRFGSKSDLLPCLEMNVPTNCEVGVPKVDMMAVDGAVVVQLLKPGKSKTFLDYSVDVFEPYIRNQIAKVDRLDLVWDRYVNNSLKSTARVKQGTGVRVHVGPSVPMPQKWTEFLRVDENKSELFRFLSQRAVSVPVPSSKYISATLDESVLFSQSNDFDSLQPCTHEEADTRLVLHVYNAAKAGYKRLSIRTVDTNVLVIAVSFWQNLSCDELWIGFGTRKHFRYIAVHEIANTLGPEKSRALPIFHALTGCDTTSAFHGKGKKTAWETWSSFPDITDAFLLVTDLGQEISEETFTVFERFIILMYDRTSSRSNINCARQYLFTKKGLQICKIPPIQDALRQHIKRAMYQSVHVWRQALVTEPVLPKPDEWGWVMSGSVCNPLWITLHEADK